MRINRFSPGVPQTMGRQMRDILATKLAVRLLMTVSCICTMTLGCKDAGVEPEPTTLPTSNSVVDAQRLIIGHWTWKSYWWGTQESPAPVAEEMVFSSDGIVRTYRDGQLSSTSQYSFISYGKTMGLVLDSRRMMFDFRISGNYFSWDHRIWDGDARLYMRTNSWEP